MSSSIFMWLSHPKHRESFWLLGAILAAKIVLAVIDHESRFFMGDSVSYLATAVDGWIPPDRSFLYGYFIRWVVLPFQNIEVLVFAQVVLSALTVWLGVEIVRRAGLQNRLLLWGLGLVWAVAPIQLMYERFMMSECVSLFVFAIHLAIGAQFIRRPHAIWFGALALTAFLLVALRVSYLPNVMLSAVVLPLMALHPSSTGSSSPDSPWGPRVRATAVYLALSLVLTGVALTGYKQLYAYKSGNPLAYHARQGYFILATVTPLLSPSDFADPDLRAAVFAEGGLDLKDPALREEQLWNGEGLLRRMERWIGDSNAVDQVAREIAMDAIVSHPVKFIGLGWMNARAYLQPEIVAEMVRLDLNRDRPLFGEFEHKLIESLSYNGDWKRSSLTADFFFQSVPWYVLLVAVSLPLGLAAMAVSFSRDRLALFAATHLLMAFGVVMWLAITATVRYLHVVEFLFLLTLGLTAAELLARRSTRAEKQAAAGAE